MSGNDCRIWGSRAQRLGGLVCIAGYVALASGLRAQQTMEVSVHPSDGTYSIEEPHLSILQSGVEVEMDGRRLRSSDYPNHTIATSTVTDDLGPAKEWAVTFSGLAGQPDLLYRLRAYPDKPFGDVQVIVRNGTQQAVHVESIRAISASGSSLLELDGPAREDRVLSDSFSEDRPNIRIHDLADSPGQMHLGVGSQLVYNRQSRSSFFVGALTSDKFMTVLRLQLSGPSDAPQIASYEVESTGTTELTKKYSLRDSPEEDRVALKVEVAAGAELASERILFGVDSDYHRQLETYGSLIKQLHHARVTSPTLLGWWSWIPYYFGLNEGSALTEAQWLAQHLKSLGYQYFVMDEGYQYARGEYSTSDAGLFPNGVGHFESKVRGLGLTPGIWTAPFEATERSWVYQNHPEWLVHNAAGKPIHIGMMPFSKEQMFALDPTHPGAQEYLRQTYSTLVNEWGIRYIKMDFMEDSGVEGYFYRPNTSAMEAQRIGWQTIRQAVGEDVLLDKDGCEMLNAVGYVDSGRISADTANAFSSTVYAASGVAARYYMNRNFYVADPDAFSVSRQTSSERSDHPRAPLTLDEAKASIALAAVSGGMFEIGDNLTTLGSDHERLALVTNKELIAMARLGHSSVPLDLLSYRSEDQQPSVFLLREDARRTMLTVFNWTDEPRSHTIVLADLGLTSKKGYAVFDVLDNGKSVPTSSQSLKMDLPAHSVHMLKLVDSSIPAAAPAIRLEHPSDAKAGVTQDFAAHTVNSDTAVLSYDWDFGDGVQLEGSRVTHAYPRAGQYTVTVTATSIDGLAGKESFLLPVGGVMPSEYNPAAKQRFESGTGKRD